MMVAFVVRLALDQLAGGDVVGYLEEVDTGERAPCGDAAELVAGMQRIAVAALARSAPET